MEKSELLFPGDMYMWVGVYMLLDIDSCFRALLGHMLAASNDITVIEDTHLGFGGLTFF